MRSMMQTSDNIAKRLVSVKLACDWQPSLPASNVARLSLKSAILHFLLLLLHYYLLSEEWFHL